MNLLDKIFEQLFANRVLLHISYWVAFVVLHCIYGLGYGQPILVSLILKFIMLPSQILAFYSFVYLILPMFYRKEFWKGGIILLAAGYLFATVAHFNYDFGLGTFLASWHKPHSILEILTDPEFLFRNMVDVYLIVFVTATIKIIKDLLESRQIMDQLEVQKSKSQIQFLQAKLQQEFMLRTFKLIKNKSIRGDVDTPEVIASLSDVLSEALYNTNPISRNLLTEVQGLQKYANLYALSSDRIEDISIEWRLENELAQIPTLSLHNTVEEVFDQIENQLQVPTKVDIVVIEVGMHCTLQITIESSEKFTLNQQKVESILQVQTDYPFSIESMNDASSIDIQIIFEL